MKKYILPLMLLAITACGAKAQNSTGNSQPEQVIAVADRVAAPDFTLNDINGNLLSLSDLKGK